MEGAGAAGCGSRSDSSGSDVEMQMASMSARSAPGPRDRRPGLVVPAAVTLALLSLFILLLDVSRHGLRAGPGVFCGLLLLAAVGLVWGGRVGYWFGLAMAAVLGALFVLALVRRGLGVGSLVAIGIGLTPLVLLLPAMRRSPRPVVRRQPPADLDPASAGGRSLALAWPQGWTRPLARGWVTFGLMLAGAVVLTPVGLAMVASGRGADRWVGVSVTLFGLALAGVAPLLRPVRRRGNARLGSETVDVGHRRERGVGLPYSRLRTASAFLAGGAMALAMAAAIPGTETGSLTTPATRRGGHGSSASSGSPYSSWWSLRGRAKGSAGAGESCSLPQQSSSPRGRTSPWCRGRPWTRSGRSRRRSM